jgi:outer membrane lipoprotein-sorting protein
MKILKLVLVAFIVSFSTQINAQTVDEILANYFKNTGGLENWSKITGIKMTLKVNNNGMEIPVEVVNLKNGKQYSKVTFQGKVIMQNVFDGGSLWGHNFMTMKAEKSDAETTSNFKKDAKDFNTSIITGSLINYKEKGYSVELLGKETIDGTETFKIKLTKKPVTVDGVKEDDISFYFFDTENYVPIALQTEIKSGQAKGMISEIKVSDYDEVDGLYFPFSMTQGIKGQPGATVTISAIELNPKVDDSIFVFPEGTESTDDKKN